MEKTPMQDKWNRTSCILLNSKDKLNELENSGFKIIEVKQYKSRFGGQEVSIIYRNKYWYERLFS